MLNRNLALAAAGLLILAGLALTLSSLLEDAPTEPTVVIGHAAQQIEPYTIISQDMLKAGEPIPASRALSQGAYPAHAVVGLMSTDMIPAGSPITGIVAKPVREVRFAEDLGLEIVSFSTNVDRLVGGNLRAGHLVNLYGYGKDPDSRQGFTTLIEPRLWVVEVTAGGRDVIVETPQPDLQTGEYKEIVGGRSQQGTLLTVAVQPENAFKIIDSLGAQGMSAWVTLAANQTVDFAATPVATAGPPPTVGLPPDLALTATALWEAINATPQAPLPRTGFGGTQ